MSNDWKEWYKSRTVWIALLQVISGLALLVADQLAAGVVLSVSGMVHLLLRAVTESKIVWK